MMKIKLLILMMLFSFGLSAQTTWTNVGNGLQQRVVSGKTEYRFIKTTGYTPFGVSDSLDKKLNLSGGNMSGRISFYPTIFPEGNINPNAGRGIFFGKNSDNASIYFESTGDLTGDSNLIFETGDNDGGTPGGATEGFVFRKYTVDGMSDIMRINLSDFKYKTYNVYHSGNLPTLKTDIGFGQPNGFASLDGSGKVPLGQINDALLGAVNYKGTYNASTNTPALPTAATANKGFYYIVSTAGTQFGLTLAVGDWIISNGSSYGKVDNNNSVTSVSGRTGAVTLTKSDVGLNNVDNTSDANKPVSTATQTALNLKANTNGSNATGLWPISIEGNSETSTVWGGKGANLLTGVSSVESVLAVDATGGAVRTATGANLQSFLGLNNGSTLVNNISGTAGSENLSTVTARNSVTTSTISAATATAPGHLTTKAQMDAADALKVNASNGTLTGTTSIDRIQFASNTTSFSSGSIFKHSDFGLVNYGVTGTTSQDWGVWRPGGSTVLYTRNNDVYVPLGSFNVNTQDVNIGTIGKGVVIKSPDGSQWRITVSDAGALITTKL